MGRRQRQLLCASLGTFLLLLVYLYHRTTESYSVSSSPAPRTTLDDATLANLIGKAHPNTRWRNLPVQYPVSEVKPLPRLSPKLPKVQSTHSKISQSTLGRQTSRQLAVKEAFERCWKSYKSLAWAADELAPITGSRRDELGGWGVTLIDNLDTLWIMGMHEDFESAVNVAIRAKFHKPKSPMVNTQQLNIQLLGGLLAAFDLSSDLRLLEKAIEVGDMLYVAFDTPNRMPIIHWSPHKALRHEKQLAEESVLGAELGSFVLEFTRLSQITSDARYFDAARRVMEAFDRQQEKTKFAGLWPVTINARTKTFHGDSFALDAEASFLFKSLPGAYALLGGQMPMYRKMYEDFTRAAASYNIFRPMNIERKEILLSGVARIFKQDNDKPQTCLEPQMHYQFCFAGGLFALGGALFQIPIHKEIAHKLVDGCIWAHHVMPRGMMPAVFNTVPCASETECPWNERLWKQEVWKNANSLEPEPLPHLDVETWIKNHRLSKGIVGIRDTAYTLRPEAIESMFILYRITGREDLLDTAWNMFQTIQNVTQVKYGNAAIADVTAEISELVHEDSMDSMWMSQTLKYFYLMFSSPELISLDKFVFNAGGHPLRQPEIS